MSLKKNILANYFGQVWVALMSLAFIPFYIERLGIEAFGLVGFFALLQGMFRLIDLGMSTALNREMARYTGGAINIGTARDLTRTIEIVTIALAALVFISIWMFADLIGRDWFKATELNDSIINNSIKVMGGITALRMVEAVYTSSITGLQHQVAYNIATATMATIRWTGCALILIIFKPSIINFFLWQLFVSALSTLLFKLKLNNIIFYSNAKAHFSLSVLSGVKNFASGVFFVTVLGMVLSQSDKIYLSRNLDLKDFGYYSLAVVIAGGLYYLSVPIQQAYMPRLNQLYAANKISDFNSAYHMALQLVAVIIGSVSMTMVFFSKEVLIIWTGDREIADQTANLLRLLCVGNMLSCLLSIPLQISLSIGAIRRVVYLYLISATMYIPMIMVAGWSFGAKGAASAWLALNVITLVFFLPYIEGRTLLQNLTDWTADALRPIICAITVIYVAFELMPNSLSDFAIILYILGALASGLISSALVSRRVRFALAQITELIRQRY